MRRFSSKYKENEGKITFRLDLNDKNYIHILMITN